MAVAKSLDELARAFTGEASLPTFYSPIPGGTYCEGCGRLRVAHVDDACVAPAGGKRSKRMPAGDDVHAQRDALHEALASLVVQVRRVGGYAPTEDQQALRHAEALLVEVTRGT